MGAVKSIDHGYDALVKRVYALGTPSVSMGVLAKDGEEPKKNAEGVVPAGGEAVRVIDAATWAEFGTDTEPERSWLRAWYDQAEPQMREDLRRLMVLVVQGKMTKEQALELIGQKGVGQIQARIAAGIPPENAPSTVAAKGSSKPLIAGGQFRSAISYAVNTK